MASSSLKLQAYQKIKSLILSCEFVPGSTITEDILLDRFSLSRTPLREALITLEQEGLLNIKPKKGILISDITFEDAVKMYETRLLIEPYVIQSYGNRIDTTEYLNYHKQFSNLLQANCTFSDFELDDDFHKHFIQVSKNNYLINTYNHICNQSIRLRRLTRINSNSNLDETTLEHISIIEACLENDWALAANKMILHLERSRSNSLKGLLN